ncbi:acyl-CoA thioester hydrolase/BAAT C-terminal domain-containing protein [soil metagenome]
MPFPRTSLAILLAMAAHPATQAYAQQIPVPAATAVPVRSDGLVATWYPPLSGKRGPVILALGGSEGGEGGSKALARALAPHGYGVLALAYFNADGLPQAVQEIPLEYFDRALTWIASQPLADVKHIGIYGISVGGETALVVAARHPEIRAVVAAVPTSVVWQGFNPADYRSIKSTYSLNGVGVPYVPYDNNAAFTGILDLYQRSLKGIAAHPDAIIPVEKIGGPILLLSAKDDKMWPSTLMSDQVIARLDSNRFKYAHTHIAYADAGHGAMSPPDGRPPSADGAFDNFGGTAAGNAAARTDMWARVLAFFDAALRPAKR